MKVWNWVAMAVAILFGAQFAQGVSVGDRFPEVKIDRHDQKATLLPTSFDGKVTVINFWATWCDSCKVELAEMEEVLTPYLAKDDFRLIFVSLDKDPKNARDWFGANLKDPTRFLDLLYVDPQFVTAEKLGIDSFPMTFVIGKQGKVHHIQRGFQQGEGSTAKIAKLAGDLLKNPENSESLN